MNKYLLSGIAVAAAYAAVPASADVNFCNRTGQQLQFAIASPVQVPYVTKQISGWYNVRSGACRTMLRGDYRGVEIYYSANYMDRREYKPTYTSRTFPFCVKDQPFTRRGSYPVLQNNCPYGWYRQTFYAAKPNALNMTYYFGN